MIVKFKSELDKMNGDNQMKKLNKGDLIRRAMYMISGDFDRNILVKEGDKELDSILAELVEAKKQIEESEYTCGIAHICERRRLARIRGLKAIETLEHQDTMVETKLELLNIAVRLLKSISDE